LCGSPLEKGYVNSARHVFWDTKIHGGFFAVSQGEIIKPLSRGIHYFEAYRCVKCKLVLLKYGEKTELPQRTW
jgi:hypothetical protein